MRAYSAQNPHGVPVPADIMANYVMTAGTGQAADWPDGANVVRFRGATTAGAAYAFAVNMLSTQAVWPAATVTATSDSTGRNTIVPAGNDLTLQVPSDSTGFSLIGGTSGIVSIEFWTK